jgi:hypothetical protein
MVIGYTVIRLYGYTVIRLYGYSYRLYGVVGCVLTSPPLERFHHVAEYNY